MGQLIISDLNFCRSEFPSEREIRGGSYTYPPVSVNISNLIGNSYSNSSNTVAYQYAVGYAVSTELSSQGKLEVGLLIGGGLAFAAFDQPAVGVFVSGGITQ
jgi:hypothetical protein